MIITTKYDEAKAKRLHSEPRPDILFTFGPWIRGDNRAPVEARLRSSDMDWGDGGMTAHAGARSEFWYASCL
jgi:hypothetical protein